MSTDPTFGEWVTARVNDDISEFPAGTGWEKSQTFLHLVAAPILVNKFCDRTLPLPQRVDVDARTLGSMYLSREQNHRSWQRRWSALDDEERGEAYELSDRAVRNTRDFPMLLTPGSQGRADELHWVPTQLVELAHGMAKDITDAGITVPPGFATVGWVATCLTTIEYALARSPHSPYGDAEENRIAAAVIEGTAEFVADSSTAAFVGGSGRIAHRWLLSDAAGDDEERQQTLLGYNLAAEVAKQHPGRLFEALDRAFPTIVDLYNPQAYVRDRLGSAPR